MMPNAQSTHSPLKMGTPSYVRSSWQRLLTQRSLLSARFCEYCSSNVPSAVHSGIKVPIDNDLRHAPFSARIHTGRHASVTGTVRFRKARQQTQTAALSATVRERVRPPHHHL